MTISITRATALALLTATPAFADQLVISEWGYTPDETAEIANAPFAEAHDVEIVTETGNNPDRLNKMAVRGGVDVIFLTDAFSHQGIDRDLFQPIDRSLIPNLDALYDVAQAPQGEDYGPAYVLGRYGIIYDTAAVDAPITSWADLWREDLVGKVAMPGFNTTSGPLTVLMAADRVGVDAFEDPDAAFASMAELEPNIVKTYNSGSELVNLFTTGEVVVGALQDFAVPAIKAAIPTAEWAPLDEGNFAIFNTINIAKDAENVELAHEYINWRLSNEAQTQMALAVGDGPVRRDVELDPEGEYAFGYGEEAFSNLQQPDYGQLLAVRDDWSRRWNEIFGN